MYLNGINHKHCGALCVGLLQSPTVSWNIQFHFGGWGYYLWDYLERLCHCHWGNWCFSELDERLLLSIETLIPKELSQMFLCPPNPKVFFSVDCERLDFTEKARFEEAASKILNAYRSGRRFTKTVIQEPPFWKDSFLYGTVHLNI